MYTYLFETLLSVLLGNVSRSGIAGPYADSTSNFFWEWLYCFPHRRYHFAFPPAVHGVLISPHPHQQLLFRFGLVLIVATLMGVRWELPVVLICVSLM